MLEFSVESSVKLMTTQLKINITIPFHYMIQTLWVKHCLNMNIEADESCIQNATEKSIIKLVST